MEAIFPSPAFSPPTVLGDGLLDISDICLFSLEEIMLYGKIKGLMRGRARVSCLVVSEKNVDFQEGQITFRNVFWPSMFKQHKMVTERECDQMLTDFPAAIYQKERV